MGGHVCVRSVFFSKIRRPPRSTLSSSSAASDVYKRQVHGSVYDEIEIEDLDFDQSTGIFTYSCPCGDRFRISLDELKNGKNIAAVSYTHLRAHETGRNLVCRLLLEKKKKRKKDKTQK
eukprot:TRINITY_DN6438_c0_g1_i4.p3 TRINITY_DN6438_c0_g1~~TRINITY_DN6438_c0_g1_i4.p3  ORF type:complete len:119 (-),score=31.79 TRINITY_DN6438_c0_g1_i4:3-359(-)